MSLMVDNDTKGEDIQVQMVEAGQKVLIWVIYGPVSLRVYIPKIWLLIPVVIL